MANSYYDPGGGRRDQVERLFARIAHRYDLINDLQSFGLHRAWKRRVVRLAKPAPGLAALDICCGTGDIALGLARCHARVTGLDFSKPMLEVARKRAAAHLQKRSQTGHPVSVFGHAPGEASLNFIQGDAQELPFPDLTFDIVTVGYGLRNLSDWVRGLDEMRRVAKPGGRLLVLDFGKPDNRFWRACYFAYLRLFVPLLGLIFCGSAAAYAYILESLVRYPAQRGVEQRMREMGLVDVRTENLLGGIMSINYGVVPGSGS